nr:reverse transcriptase domain-containing protein [Tanacetum cinerariifolium]
LFEGYVVYLREDPIWASKGRPSSRRGGYVIIWVDREVDHYGNANLGFKEILNRDRSRIERNTKGNRPSKAGAEENGRREINLPPLLAAHLGRNENGQPLQSSLTSVYGGRQSLINIGGNLPPNVPTTTPMFSATTPENTPLAYRASTSTNPNLVISPAFMEANYETLESLPRDRRRQMRNNDLQTKLEYFNEDYDEEIEMEPRPGPTIAVTPPL